MIYITRGESFSAIQAVNYNLNQQTIADSCIDELSIRLLNITRLSIGLGHGVSSKLKRQIMERNLEK
jgi:hypothetical protein